MSVRPLRPARWASAPILTLPALALLAACSGGGAAGGGGSPGDPATGPDGAESYTLDLEGKEERVDDIGTVYDEVYGGKPMPGALAPTTGTATFNGAVSFGSQVKDPDLVAALAVTVDFGTAGVTGSMWDFHDRAGHVAGGSVALTGEVPEESPSSVVLGGQGLLDWGPEQIYLRIDMTGDLYGAKADWLYGQGVATLTTDGVEETYTATLGGDNDRVD
ncbi:hypothetical protein [Pseudoroseicyclus tamaricis]|uniref:Transferrin-binding protein B C-lobe/N-lobe beta barrel domain-containing protein n=1 Tax=Pseudoroseicyclus tamaricis TaxID=2705421 RepID=A0A6B2K0M7_9RHOB|nr:hypothetical protein [Pseudoroseicyclus tamaricis]NDV02499.1 hypothetical protein [Pseudoroseicyclus tamaricis]